MFKKLALLFAALFVPLLAPGARATEGGRSEGYSTDKGSRYQIVRFTGKDAVPSKLSLSGSENGVFFFNDSEGQAMNLSVEFGKHPAHCASPLMKMGEDGVYRSESPIAPKQFAAVCFPFSGTYPFRAEAPGDSRKFWSGEITVER